MKTLFFLMAGFGSMACVGCGPPAGQRATAPVDVMVTYKGKPVEGATVTFITSQEPFPSNGITDAAGKCALSSYGIKDGAVIGTSLVTIKKVEEDKTKAKVVSPENADAVGYTPLQPLKDLVPAKYSAPGTSGLKEEVKKGKNSFSYELKD